MRMADLKAYTSVYQFPYPLAGDSVQNTYARIQELAERIEVTYQILGIDLSASAQLVQFGDELVGGDISGAWPSFTIRAGAVVTDKILDNAVTAAKIADNSVDTDSIQSGAVTSDKLSVVDLPNGSTATTQPQSDGSTRLATTAYVDSYIAGTVPDESIGTAELEDGAVTNAKVADDAAIAYSKLDLDDSIVESDLSFDIATQEELDGVSESLQDHVDATTSVHGIADTEDLATKEYADESSGAALASAEGYTDSAVSTHSDETTSVHGISDTEDLVYTDDSRLSDDRDPNAHAASHELGGADEIEIDPTQVTGTAVVDNDSRLTDARTPTSHATSHEDGGSDEVELAPTQITGTAVVDNDSRLTDSRIPTTHASSHESGGADELELAPSQVTGTAVVDNDARLTDARTPTTHASSHVPGGSDALDLTKIIAVGTSLPTDFSLYPAGALFGVGTVAPYLLHRSTGTAWEQIGGAGGAGIEVSDTAPIGPDAGDLWYDSTTGKTFIWYEDGSSNQWVEVGANAQIVIPQHGASHVRGGVDVIDGDRLTVDYVPTAYTRDSAASGAGDVTDLTAHLAGIEKKLQAVSNIQSQTLTTTTQVTVTTGGVFYDTGLSVILTPVFANSKILLMSNIDLSCATTDALIGLRFVRNGAAVGVATSTSNRIATTTGVYYGGAIMNSSSNHYPIAFTFVDTVPSITPLTYKVQVTANINGTIISVNRSSGDSDSVNTFRATSTLTAQEIIQ
jgi:hypothetical protein